MSTPVLTRRFSNLVPLDAPTAVRGFAAEAHANGFVVDTQEWSNDTDEHDATCPSHTRRWRVYARHVETGQVLRLAVSVRSSGNRYEFHESPVDSFGKLIPITLADLRKAVAA